MHPKLRYPVIYHITLLGTMNRKQLKARTKVGRKNSYKNFNAILRRRKGREMKQLLRMSRKKF
jgi:hypothetical protein